MKKEVEMNETSGGKGKYVTSGIDILYGVLKKLNNLIVIYLYLIGILSLAVYFPNEYISKLLVGSINIDMGMIITNGSLFQVAISSWIIYILFWYVGFIFKGIIFLRSNKKLFWMKSIECAVCCGISFPLHKMSALNITYEVMLYYVVAFLIIKFLLTLIVKYEGLDSYYFGLYKKVSVPIVISATKSENVDKE